MLPLKNADLPEVLRNARSAKGLSLRQVEKKTGISNAYLSQLENGKIIQPSPHILHSLAEVYETSYNDLMIIAGYIKKNADENTKGKLMSDVAYSAINELSPEERKEVIEYIKFLRSKRRKD